MPGRSLHAVDERIPLIEDDPSIREVVALGLGRAGFRVSSTADGRDGLARTRDEPFDLILLDVMLPSMDGFEVLRGIRRDGATPVVMLTARTDTTDVVVGLELGADDYVTKPFELSELVARVRAVLRRAGAERPAATLRLGSLEVDTGAFTATRDGEALALTATEFRLLVELARHPGQVFTRELLLQRVWNYDYLGDSRLVDVAVQRLRAKIEEDPARPALVVTVRGVGYRLDPPAGR